MVKSRICHPSIPLPGALLLAAGFFVWGQEAVASDTGQLSEIVVTAQKRSQNVQQVPIAITTFTADVLKDEGITTVHGMADLTPNVTLDEGSPFSGSSAVLSAKIRGIGQDDFAFNLDPGVGVYLDGAYLARTVGANLNLPDVERVEILKGPQGTLFGRNTIGGAISVVTHTPGDSYAVTGEATVGSLSRHDFDATVDVPLTETLLSTFTVSSIQRDGWQKRVPYPGAGVVQDSASFPGSAPFQSGSAQGGKNEQTLRAKFLWTPRDDLKVTLTADWTHVDEEATPNTALNAPNTVGSIASIYNTCVTLPVFVLATIPGIDNVCLKPIANSGVVLGGSGRLPYTAAISNTGNINTTYATGNDFSRMDSFGGSFTLDWKIAEDMQLKSITAYRRLNWSSGLDNDGSPLDILELSFSEGQHQVSQEFQLTGDAFDSKLKYLAGLYYFNEGGFIHDHVDFDEGLLQVDGPNYLDTTSYAAFTHADYQLTDTIGFTLGARYSLEQKQFTGEQADPDGFVYKISGCYPPQASASIIGAPASLTCQQALGFPVPGQPLRFYPAGVNNQTYYLFTPTAGIQYKIDNDLMTYFSYSKGFKSGGWTTRLSSPVSVAPSFGPEKASTYEVGTKSEFLDHKVRLNVAAFYTQYNGIQLNFQEGASPTYQNAGNAEILGLEAEGRAVLGHGFSVGGSAGYMDAYYTSLLPGINFGQTCTGVAPSCINIGSKLPKTPKWKIALTPEYVMGLANDATMRFAVQWTHTASEFNDAVNTPILRRSDTETVNAQVSYLSPDDRYEVTLGGTNITDQRYLVVGSCNYAAAGCAGTYNDPAEWYLKLKVHFGAS